MVYVGVWFEFVSVLYLLLSTPFKIAFRPDTDLTLLIDYLADFYIIIYYVRSLYKQYKSSREEKRDTVIEMGVLSPKSTLKSLKKSGSASSVKMDFPVKEGVTLDMNTVLWLVKCFGIIWIEFIWLGLMYSKNVYYWLRVTRLFLLPWFFLMCRKILRRKIDQLDHQSNYSVSLLKDKASFVEKDDVLNLSNLEKKQYYFNFVFC